MLYNSSVVVQFVLTFISISSIDDSHALHRELFHKRAVLVSLIVPYFVKVKTFTSRGLHYLPSIFLIIIISDFVKVKTFTSLSLTSD